MPQRDQNAPREVFIISDDEEIEEESNGDAAPPPNNQAAVSGDALLASREELRQVYQGRYLT